MNNTHAMLLMMSLMVLGAAVACDTARPAKEAAKDAPKETARETTPAKAAEGHNEEEEHEVELAALMLRMQIHADKLYFAGNVSNWPLTNFYLHELEETLEEIAEAKITEDGFAVSDAVQGFMGKPIEAMEAAAKTKDAAAFGTGYEQMVTACNGCHTASKHGFIVIQRPTRPIFTNQRFEP